MRKRVILTITAALGIAAVLYMMWKQGYFLPQWAAWKETAIHDVSDSYEIILQDRKVTVRNKDKIIWTSPKEVQVQDILSCDIEGDGADELVLLCWKRGRYGKHKPFWIKKDEKSWSQHIFVYEYDISRIKPKWQSSYIGVDVTEITSVIERDGCRLWLTDTKGKDSCWRWDSWGFVKENTDVSFVVFGDNLLHEPIYRYGLRSDEGFDFLFENIKDLLVESDIAVINQETPLVEQPTMYGGYPSFGTPLAAGEAIVEAGFDVVTCATNHALDRGSAGIQTTKDFFESHKLLCLGIQTKSEPEYRPYEMITRNGIRFAMFNYTYGTNGIRLPKEYPYMVHLLDEEERVAQEIKEAKAEADMVLVFVHWGTENAAQPDDFQKKWAQVFLESGVDIVIGTHPHTVQPFEVRTAGNGHRMLIYYSIGNYISAQPEEVCCKGGMARFTVARTSKGCRITAYDLRPLCIVRHQGGKYTVEFQKERERKE